MYPEKVMIVLFIGIIELISLIKYEYNNAICAPAETPPILNNNLFPSKPLLINSFLIALILSVISSRILKIFDILFSELIKV